MFLTGGFCRGFLGHGFCLHNFHNLFKNNLYSNPLTFLALCCIVCLALKAMEC